MKTKLKTINTMKKKIYLQFVTVLVCFVVGNTFANNANNQGVICKEVFAVHQMIQQSPDVNDRELQITKKTEKGLDIYTFSPDNEVDKETLAAIENRLKVVAEGFVSLSVNDKNEVKLVTNPGVITDERLDFCLRVVAKVYEYSNYTI